MAITNRATYFFNSTYKLLSFINFYFFQQNATGHGQRSTTSYYNNSLQHNDEHV